MIALAHARTGGQRLRVEPHTRIFPPIRRHVPGRNDDLRDALKRAASALRAQGPDFALAGSYVLRVFGGPEPVHDVDFVVAEPDTEKAVPAMLEDAGFSIERTPEDWLFKACVGNDFVIDVLHRLNGVPVEAGTVQATDEFDVLAVKDAAS